MNSRSLLITALLIVGFSFHNCSDPFDCGDFGEVHDFFDIQGLSIFHVDADGGPLDSDSIRYRDYGYFTIYYDVEYLAYQQERSFDFSLMSQAYGCSPEIAGLAGSKEEAYESITIITLNDFDENHMANDTINDLILSGYSDTEQIELDGFIDGQEGNVESQYLYLSLKKKPSLNQEFQFRIRVDLSTGERYERISDPVVFKS